MPVRLIGCPAPDIGLAREPRERDGPAGSRLNRQDLGERAGRPTRLPLYSHCRQWRMTNLIGGTRLIVSTRNSAGGIRTPFRPRPGKQRCAVTDCRERRDRDAGRHAGSAVRAESCGVFDAVLGEQLAHLVFGDKSAVAVEHVAAGQVFGSGDMSGHPIHRLDVAGSVPARARREASGLRR